ncbi:MAG: hypothetical protein CMN76_12930 [Spirochaetaceae bacterium]|nr:hypothetical protein [Spirochaetaceae bacterium]
MRASISLIPLNVLFKAIVTERMEGFYRVGKEKPGAGSGACGSDKGSEIGIMRTSRGHGLLRLMVSNRF